MKSIANLILPIVAAAAVLQLFAPCAAFSPSTATQKTLSLNHQVSSPYSKTQLFERFTEQRKKQLGIIDGDDEYDLGMALENNTDPLISKLVAGSFILVMITLLVVGVVIPYTADYGEGVCNPLLTAGRC